MIDPPSEIRRVVYLGSPAVAVAPLRALCAAGFEVALVVSGPDKRRGRGSAATPTPVKAAAAELGLPVTTSVDDVLEVGADLGVVVAYGRIIRPHVLDRLAMVNLHFSLLPRWRGAAPVERAILAGDEKTGVCVMEVVDELDAGGVYSCAEVSIGFDETAAELSDRLVRIGTDLMIASLRSGLGTPAPQQGDPSYARKIDPAELQIEWSRPAVELQRLVRIGGAWTTFRGSRLKVWRAGVSEGATDLRPGEIDGATVATGSGSLELIEVQPEGKSRRSALDWSNGARCAPGELLGDP